ncbi:DUF4376 domain-containing protein [Pseudomonas moraviensis]|uniref:DUF4376 domain-containing protein n=1 Tax=Pseudomonas moraviensis R28-S TaxID=1395516 RepID=V8R804_9PSED|nr:DUF4376 domain-containing protein [Pseudomonas moraviensis]ETF07788.1 hypothetical protein PMO01_17180 [Pseudomonas moraviensis R28-S]
MTDFVNKASGAVLTPEEFRARFDGLMLPEHPENHQLKGTAADGWAVLELDPKPDDGYTPGPIRQEDGRFIQSWLPPVLTPEQWLGRIAARRYQAEISGTTIDGIPLDTGRDSQGLITGAAVQAIIDPAYSLHWKTSAGFVELTGQQILGVASMVRAHVQACFNREAVLLGAVADGSITAEMLEEGWPV